MKIQILKCGDKHAVIYKEGWFYPWLYVTHFARQFDLLKKRNISDWEPSYERAERVMNDFIEHLKKTHAKVEVVKSVKLKVSQ